jgi:hypothetical protein
MANLVTYSGMDVNASFVHPFIGSIQAGGIASNGLQKLQIRMLTTRTTMKVGMDGAVIPSAIPGRNGEIELEVWQTSTLHQELLAWFNSLEAAQYAGDVSQWAIGVALIKCIVDGSTHTATGIAPTKVPDKTYSAEAQTVTWILACANIVNE